MMIVPAGVKVAPGAGLHRQEERHGLVGYAGPGDAEEGSVLRPSLRLPGQTSADRQDPVLGRQWAVPVHQAAIDRGGFVWPRLTRYEGSITLSPAQLAML